MCVANLLRLSGARECVTQRILGFTTRYTTSVKKFTNT